MRSHTCRLSGTWVTRLRLPGVLHRTGRPLPISYVALLSRGDNAHRALAKALRRRPVTLLPVTLLPVTLLPRRGLSWALCISLGRLRVSLRSLSLSLHVSLRSLPVPLHSRVLTLRSLTLRTLSIPLRSRHIPLRPHRGVRGNCCTGNEHVVGEEELASPERRKLVKSSLWH